MLVMTRGVEQPHELIQQATLVENYYIRSPQIPATQRTQVRFDIGLGGTNTTHVWHAVLVFNLFFQISKINCRYLKFRYLQLIRDISN